MNKKVYIILAGAIIFLSITVFLIHDSYAKYLTALNETTNIRVARWRILVNNNDIRYINQNIICNHKNFQLLNSFQ